MRVDASERLRDERALARTRDAGDDGQHTHRNVDRDVLEIGQRDMLDRQLPLRFPALVLDLPSATQTGPGDRVGRAELLVRSLEHERATVCACPRTDFADVADAIAYVAAVLAH